MTLLRSAMIEPTHTTPLRPPAVLIQNAARDR